MHRTLPYIVLFVLLCLVQIFLLNHLVAWSVFSPLLYVAFIILLPLDTKPIVLLLTALLTGVVMDYTMGIAGLNTVATLPVAFFRPHIIRLLSSREDSRDEGIPSPERMGKNLYWSYVSAMVILHHTLFFLLEALTWGHLVELALRLVLSSAATIILVRLVGKLFTAKYTTRNNDKPLGRL